MQQPNNTQQQIDKEDTHLQYSELCNSYHPVDDFRAKLLGVAEGLYFFIN